MDNTKYNTPISFATYQHPLDLFRTSARGLIYSYAPDADLPLVFRHYNHKSAEESEFSNQNLDNRCMFIVYLSGDFDFIVGNNMYNPEYGDIFVINSNENFLCKTNIDCIFDYFQIDIPTCFFDNIFNPPFFSNIFLDRNIGENNIIRLNNTQKERCINRLLKMEELISNISPENDITAFSYFIQIMNIINTHADSAHALPLPIYTPTCVIKAMEYIHKNFTSLTNLDDVVEISGKSAVYLRKSFKRINGCTITEYVQNLRINYAKKLLKSDKDITTIAYESGFSSTSYFIAMFKKHFGITPLKYKQMHQKEE